jgi:hypothetical protein
MYIQMPSVARANNNKKCSPTDRKWRVSDGGDVVGHFLPCNTLELIVDCVILNVFANVALAFAAVGNAFVPHVLNIGIHTPFTLHRLFFVFLVG